MKFKAGDRVHVTRLKGDDVDFYGTLSNHTENPQHYLRLNNCSKSEFNSEVIYMPKNSNFGKDKFDYCVLATDEEDTEKPEIQYISDMYNAPCERLERRTNNVELDDEYIIEVKKDVYVQVVTSNDYFRFTENIKESKVYEDKSEALEYAEFIGGRVLNIKRYVEVD